MAESKLLNPGGDVSVGQPNRIGLRTISRTSSGRTLGFCRSVTDEDVMNGSVDAVESRKILDAKDTALASARKKAEEAEAAAKAAAKELEGPPSGGPGKVTKESEAG